VPRSSFGARLYQRLLRLYPSEFRDEFGGEMAGLYRDRIRDEGAVRVWLALFADLLRTAPREHLSALAQDVRHAVRLFRSAPIVTITTIVTIAIALSGTTAVFGVVYGVMLRPLPYPGPDRLVELFEDNRPANMAFFRVSALNYLSWAERSAAIEALAAFQSDTFNMTDEGEPERLGGATITASMFDVLGLEPVLGRRLQAQDERPGAGRVAVLAEPFWRRRFEGDRTVVGRTISLNGERHEVIGVVPAAFREVGRTRLTSAGAPQVFVPMTIDPPRERRGNHIVRVVGRLRPGVSIAQARAEMRGIAAAMEREFPESNKGWGVSIVTLYDSMLDERVKPSLLLWLGAVAAVLLIACANVANMLLARGLSRRPELALRTALGAGRVRLVRQLLTESVCLSLVSGACGLVLSIVAIRMLRRMLPPTLPRADEIQIDAAVIAFGVLITLACGVLMGFVPAVRASGDALIGSVLRLGKGLAGSSQSRWRNGMVVMQLTLATILLVASALLLQSFVRLQEVRLGFDAERVMTARVGLPRVKYPDNGRVSEFYRRLLEVLEGMPTVEAAAAGTSAPFSSGVRAGGRATDRARTSLDRDTAINAVEHIVSADYFRVLGVPLLAGRAFGLEDTLASAPVAIVSQRAARQLWGDLSPIGRTLEWNGSRLHEVVGVVGDVRGSGGSSRGGGIEGEPAAGVYFAASQMPQRGMTLIVRTSSESAAIGPAIRSAVQLVDPAQPVSDLRRLRDLVDESAAQPRFTTALSGAFAAVALLLAAVGVYGVLSYSIVQRTQEFGVRMAVGASRSQIVRLVLRDAVLWTLAGVGIGLAGAFALSSVLGTLLFEVSARDPFTYVAVAVFLAAVAVLASYIPATRATRIDPVIALRVG
jgi:putative ABC transport system permease protein